MCSTVEKKDIISGFLVDRSVTMGFQQPGLPSTPVVVRYIKGLTLVNGFSEPVISYM